LAARETSHKTNGPPAAWLALLQRKKFRI